MSSKGFIELLRLNELGKRRKLGQHTQQKNAWSGVGFRIGDVHLIAPLGEVNEVVDNMAAATVPKSKAWLKGLVNLRGKLLPITNLTEFFSISQSGKGESVGASKKIIVIDHAETYGGLLVDQVYGILHFSKLQFIDKSVTVMPKLDSYLQGSFEQSDGRIWHVFLISKLIQDERYLDAAM